MNLNLNLTSIKPWAIVGLIVAALILAAGALTAAFIPAWRASNVSPTDALRLE